jgi:energy-coupling factor transporter ATP-binding protein EcfA2
MTPRAPAPDKTSLTSVQFREYKALSNYAVSFQHLNILVGPNNCGKSTVIGAFRALAAGLRKARSRRPTLVLGPTGREYGYQLEADQLPISIENVHTDYADTDSSVEFRLSNHNRLTLFFSKDGGCTLIPYANGRPIREVTTFKALFPLTISVVPILGPVEHNELLLDEETVTRGLETHRASRHFRNFWHQNPEGFGAFADLVQSTWSGLEIQRPERVGGGNVLSMFCLERRIARELYWAGFGFQIWCQLLTHISRSSTASVLIVDEPEVYLHPDVQRQLIGILRRAGPDVVLATHSTEIIGEADPSEVVLIDKTQRSGVRLRDASGVQNALDTIGSIQNITLTHLARSRRLLFVENEADIRTLRRFAARLGLHDLSTGLGYTVSYSGGFAAWERIKALAWGFQHTFNVQIQVGAIFDHDYWPTEQTASIETDLRRVLALAHIHSRKEIENYLVVPTVLSRAVDAQLADRRSRDPTADMPAIDISALLEEITAPTKADIQSQYIAKRALFFRSSGRDLASLSREAMAWLDARWNPMESRMEVVPGKEVLGALRHLLKERYDLGLSDARIIDAFTPADMPGDLVALLRAIDSFRTS